MRTSDLATILSACTDFRPIQMEHLADKCMAIQDAGWIAVLEQPAVSIFRVDEQLPEVAVYYASFDILPET